MHFIIELIGNPGFASKGVQHTVYYKDNQSLVEAILSDSCATELLVEYFGKSIQISEDLCFYLDIEQDRPAMCMSPQLFAHYAGRIVKVSLKEQIALHNKRCAELQESKQVSNWLPQDQAQKLSNLVRASTTEPEAVLPDWQTAMILQKQKNREMQDKFDSMQKQIGTLGEGLRVTNERFDKLLALFSQNLTEGTTKMSAEIASVKAAMEELKVTTNKKIPSETLKASDSGAIDSRKMPLCTFSMIADAVGEGKENEGLMEVVNSHFSREDCNLHARKDFIRAAFHGETKLLELIPAKYPIAIRDADFTVAFQAACLSGHNDTAIWLFHQKRMQRSLDLLKFICASGNTDILNAFITFCKGNVTHGNDLPVCLVSYHCCQNMKRVDMIKLLNWPVDIVPAYIPKLDPYEILQFANIPPKKLLEATKGNRLGYEAGLEYFISRGILALARINLFNASI